MAKPKIIYRCTACGYESAKWNGKCPSCGSWNTLEEDVPLPTQAVGNSRRKPVDLCSFRKFKQVCLVGSSKSRTFVPDYNNIKQNTATSNKIQHKNNNNNIK